MAAITKTQMINACVDFETAWFFDREIEEQKEVFRHIHLHGFTGYNKFSDENLFASCVHKGIFLMEE
jgi:hypothetical protein